MKLQHAEQDNVLNGMKNMFVLSLEHLMVVCGAGNIFLGIYIFT
jgi:hypothetical protein